MCDASPKFSPPKSTVGVAPQAEKLLESMPNIVHTLRDGKASILSVAADERYIYSGSQANEIVVWELQTLQIKTKLVGHTGSILTLECCPEKQWLFSAAADSTVRVWSTTHLSLLYVIIPEGETDAGEIFSLTYSPALSTVYFGCQNTSLQWFDLSPTKLKAKGGSPVRSDNGTPILAGKKWHKFFDSVPQSARTTNGSPATTGNTTPDHQLVHSSGDPYEAVCASLRFTCIDTGPKAVQVPPQNVILPAQYGYIYCMALSPSHLYSGDHRQRGEEISLLTGSGDEDVKVWQCTKDGLFLRHTFTGCDGGVLCLVARNGTVFGGCQDGHIKVWDLETKTLVRTLEILPRPTVGISVFHASSSVDVLSLSMIGTDLYSVLSTGWCQRWNASFEITAEWKAHDGIGLSSIITPVPANRSVNDAPQGTFLITGGSDADIKLWSIEPPLSRREQSSDGPFEQVEHNNLQTALATFVSFPSVSGVDSKREYCRQAAIWLKHCLTQLGASASLIPLEEGINPLVLATFTGSEEYKNRPRILFYGHYDVTDANREGWEGLPFELSGRNGYIYGRGVSDNKGPILAAAFAVSDLRRRLALGLDVIMLIEGEEENGSRGFKDAIHQHKEAIGHIDAIILCNSYWIGEEMPCITYGLRGVVHCGLEISSDQPDLHSGVEGGGAAEPMFDMVALLGSLYRANRILIPGFYDHVRPRTEAEDELYRLLAKVTGQDASYLASKWREPSLTIHAIEASSPGNRTVIPSRVHAQVSLRIVPDQNLHQIANSVENHLVSAFEALQSPNAFAISIDRAADFWLGNLESPWFRALESAVEGEWGIKPLRIREGGSIPSIPLLEKCFGCEALHLPMGQSSDQAHLANERISVNNLLKGKAVLERFFLSVAQSRMLVV